MESRKCSNKFIIFLLEVIVSYCIITDITLKFAHVSRHIFEVCVEVLYGFLHFFAEIGGFRLIAHFLIGFLQQFELLRKLGIAAFHSLVRFLLGRHYLVEGALLLCEVACGGHEFCLGLGKIRRGHPAHFQSLLIVLLLLLVLFELSVDAY